MRILGLEGSAQPASVLGDISQTATMTLVNSGIALLITPIIPLIIRKIGKKNVFQYCGLFTVVIKFTIGPLPTICALIAMSIFWKYPLSDKLFRQIRDENEAKKAELGAETTGAANA